MNYKEYVEYLDRYPYDPDCLLDTDDSELINRLDNIYSEI
jgi:hypothetical protein